MRSSNWPHPFVIDCYHLGHTTPLALLLPLAAAPLLLTASADGRALSVWVLHEGGLLGTLPVAGLLGSGEAGEAAAAAAGGGGDTAAAAAAQLVCACEVPSQRLVAIGLRDKPAIYFCSVAANETATTAAASSSSSGSRMPLAYAAAECTVTLPAPPAALAYSASANVLCALLLPIARDAGGSAAATTAATTAAVAAADATDAASDSPTGLVILPARTGALGFDGAPGTALHVSLQPPPTAGLLPSAGGSAAATAAAAAAPAWDTYAAELTAARGGTGPAESRAVAGADGEAGGAAAAGGASADDDQSPPRKAQCVEH